MNAKAIKERQKKPLKLSFYYKLRIRLTVNKVIKNAADLGESSTSFNPYTKYKQGKAVFYYIYDYLESKGFDVVENNGALTVSW